MTLERTHTEQIEYDAQDHEQEMARMGAERVHALALIEAKKETDLARILADSEARKVEVDFSNESQRAWRTGRLNLIAVLVGIWLSMAVVTLLVSLFNKAVADNLALFIALITIIGAVAVPAAERLYAQGYQEAQKSKQESEDES